MGFFSSKRDPVPDNGADGDHSQSRTHGKSRRVTPKGIQYPRKPAKKDPNFKVESPGRKNTPKDPKGYIER